ncbi:Dnah7 [Symbiodinium sp. KB8]|nr:Dnah7 [Symbiodinium sp. KB8]
MGAWIAAGLARLGGICGALLLAPAGARTVSKAMAGRSAGTAILPSEHSATGGYTINSTILVELEEASIADMMPAACPVCILHGDKDEAVPLEASEELLGQLLAKGGEATLRQIHGGDHRLSKPAELQVLEEELDRLILRSAAAVRNLTVCNQSALRLLYLWYGMGYGSMLLVDLPPPSTAMVDIDHFSERQKACCHEVFAKFKSQWFEEVCAILREENLHLRSPAEQRFFAGIRALLSVQTRDLVAQSVAAYADFFRRFDDPKPLSPEEVVQLKDTDDRQDAFLVVKLVPKGDEVKLKDSTERVVERVLRVFKEFVVCLNDIPSPESRIQGGGSGAKESSKNLWGTFLEEEYVQEAQKLIEQTVQFNMGNASEAERIYNEYTFLITEEERIKEFLKDSSASIPKYLEKVDALKAIDLRIRQQLPNEMRMQMVTVDCRELNETLRSRAADCMSILLEHVVGMNLERNERLCKSFGNISRHPPASEMGRSIATLLLLSPLLACGQDFLAVRNESKSAVGGCSSYGCSGCGRCFNAGSRPGVMCASGGQSGYHCPAEPTGNGDATYACLDWTFGSAAMRSGEAQFQQQTGEKVYFGVGTYGTTTDPQRGLGACYRLKVEGVDRDIIAQSVNTGWDVDGKQFDLQMGAGGTGAFNNCAGGAGSVFPGGKSSWGCTYGGVDTRSACRALPSKPSQASAMASAGDSLVRMCEYSFDKKVRVSGEGLAAGPCKYNPTLLDVARVRCPEQLVSLTQMQRSDEPGGFGFAAASRASGFPNAGGTNRCRSEDWGAGLAYCLTRMMDCLCAQADVNPELHVGNDC